MKNKSLVRMEVNFWRRASKRAGMSTIYCRVTVLGEQQLSQVSQQGNRQVTLNYRALEEYQDDVDEVRLETTL